MAVTQADIDALRTAMLTAATDREFSKTVRFGDREVTFESLADMAAFLKEMQAGAGISRSRYAATSKGL